MLETCYARLTAADSGAFGALTFPIFRSRLERLGDGPAAPLALGALLNGEAVGLALIDFSQDYAEVLSVFVKEGHRRRGVARRLLEEAEAAVSGRCRELRLAYEGDAPYTEAVERLLALRGFGEKEQRSLVCRCSGTRIRQAPWLSKDLLPAAFEIFLWSELAASQRAALRCDDWYPELLSPFREEDAVEGLNSLGLRYKGEIVGWQINHRIARDTIRYTTMFVRPDLQAFGLAIPLMIESIRRHLFSGQLWIDKATFVVPQEMSGMVDFVDRRMRPYLDEVHPSFEARKTW